MMQHKATPLERLIRKTEVSEEGCFLWTGALQAEGYARLSIGQGKKKRTFIHRYAYENLVGPIPTGMTIDHLCRVRNCWNPAHLEVVTPSENVRRAYNGDSNLCKWGHAYTPSNTGTRTRNGNTYRVCLACSARNTARSIRKRRERRFS